MAKIRVPLQLTNKDFTNRCKYPWRQWLNGQIWQLHKGEDFHVTIPSMILALNDAARRKGLLASSVPYGDNVLFIQAGVSPTTIKKFAKDNCATVRRKTVKPMFTQAEESVAAEPQSEARSERALISADELFAALELAYPGKFDLSGAVKQSEPQEAVADPVAVTVEPSPPPEADAEQEEAEIEKLPARRFVKRNRPSLLSLWR